MKDTGSIFFSAGATEGSTCLLDHCHVRKSHGVPCPAFSHEYSPPVFEFAIRADIYLNASQEGWLTDFCDHKVPF